MDALSIQKEIQWISLMKTNVHLCDEGSARLGVEASEQYMMI